MTPPPVPLVSTPSRTDLQSSLAIPKSKQSSTRTSPTKAASSTPNILQAATIYKIIVVGDLATGKTSFIRRYTQDIFHPNYKATIGVDFALKILKKPASNGGNARNVHVQLWDIAGQERIARLTRVYYKDAVAAIVAVDLSRFPTVSSAIKWKQDIDDKVKLSDGSSIPVLLVATKSDLNVEVSKETLDNLVLQHKFIGLKSTSSANNENINEAMDFLLEHITEASYSKKENVDSGHVDIAETNKAKFQRFTSNCCQ